MRDPRAVLLDDVREVVALALDPLVRLGDAGEEVAEAVVLGVEPAPDHGDCRAGRHRVIVRSVSILAERLTAQLLAGPPARDPVAVCERLLAVQGQDPRGFRLAVRARTEGCAPPTSTARWTSASSS